MTIGVLVSSLVIGASRGEPHAIRDSLMIAGWLLLLGWAGTLLVAAMVTSVGIIRRIVGRAARWASHRPEVGGGVADPWLDGPA